MRKGVFALFIIIFIFAGCQSGEPEIDYPEITDKQILYTNNNKSYIGDVVLYKYNCTDYIIDANQTGYVSSTGETKKRSIIPETRNSLRKEYDYLNYNYGATTEFQRQQWESISRLSNNSRALYSEGLPPNNDKFYIYKKYFDEKGNYLRSGYVPINKSNTKVVDGKFCTVYYTDVLDSSYASDSKVYNKLINKIKSDDKNFFERLATKFDEFYELEIKYFGSNKYSVSSQSKYANTDSKVNIIVMDINQDASEDTSKPMTLGFYSPDDLLKRTQTDSYRNEAQILYVDSYALLANENIIYSTLVHEFNHLLNDINKVVSGYNSTLANDTWYTEMLSMLAEDCFADVLGNKFSATPKTRLADFPDSYYLGFTTWLPDEEVLYSYANSFAYGSFLVRNYGGIDLLKEIACNSYVGKRSINEALKKLKYTDRFEDTVKEYYKATLNTSVIGKSFNKEIKNNSDNIGFKAMKFDEFARLKDGTILDIRPNIVNAGIDDQYMLLPTGCTIHYVGTDLDYFIFEKPLSPSMEVEILTY